MKQNQSIYIQSNWKPGYLKLPAAPTKIWLLQYEFELTMVIQTNKSDDISQATTVLMTSLFTV